MEIFGTYGKIINVDMPGGSGMSFTFRHMAVIEFENTDDAAKAAKVHPFYCFIKIRINRDI